MKKMMWFLCILAAALLMGCVPGDAETQRIENGDETDREVNRIVDEYLERVDRGNPGVDFSSPSLDPKSLSSFDVGVLNTFTSEHFTGESYLSRLSGDGDMVTVFNVTFAPGCINDWHSHTASSGGGQILIAAAGRGYCQIYGENVVEMLPGDVVRIPANVKHWHGAAPDSWFQHIAIEVPGEDTETEWLGQVNTENYAEAYESAAIQADNLVEEESDRVRLAHEKVRELLDGADIPESISESELFEIVNRTMFGDIYQDSNLTDAQREMVALAASAVNGTLTVLRFHVTAALNAGLTPLEITETVFQTTPYIGAAKALEAIGTVNDVFHENGLALPGSQSTVTEETRYTEGQRALGRISGFTDTAPEREGQKRTTDYLYPYVFGDFYTRTGLDDAQREMITFVCLAALGDTANQLRGHIPLNDTVGNHRDFLLSVISAELPFIGYPRMLNTIALINELLPETPVGQ